MKKLLVITIPIFILLLSFRLVAFDTGFYKKEFAKYNVYETLNKEEVDKNIPNLIGYLNDGSTLNGFFNERETLHLTDVRNIIQKVLLIFNVSLALVILSVFYLAYLKEYRNIGKGLLYGSLLTMAILAIFLLSSVLNFNALFTRFHLAFFENDLWLLDPNKDNLIVMFPTGFFIDITNRIIIHSFLLSAVVMLISLALMRINKPA